ncbi:MAG: cation-efflux pump, partial [Oscillospiraceae bacterium]|nr:cation-efflux pump [Oscillospiraceae bacterium]
EKRIWEETGINMTIHTDPVETDDKISSECREFVTKLISGLDPELSLHDFRLVKVNCRTCVTFDLVVPFDCIYKKEQLRDMIDTELHRFDPEFDSVITFDCEMTE